MYSVFETEIQIRPDDIDMNNHVHLSKYLDYVITGRYIQMEENYKFGVNDFIKLGYNWVARAIHIEYKKSIKVHDKITVRSQFDSYIDSRAKANFWIVLKNQNNRIAAEGFIIFSMISIETGRPVRITEKLIKPYQV